MKSEKQCVRIIEEKFEKTLTGGLRREAIVKYNNGDYETIDSKIYEARYILEKSFEYKKIISKQLLTNAIIKKEADGFTRIYHFNKEIYKIETNLFEIIKGMETKEKIYRIFSQKRSTLSYLVMIKRLGQGETCVDIAKTKKPNRKPRNITALYNKTQEIKDKIVNEFFDEFKIDNLWDIEPVILIKKFYNKYQNYIDELVKLI